MIEAAVAGFGLGLFFFAGLWWTVVHGVKADNPGLWFLGSLWLRVGVVVGGFLLVGQGDWHRLAMAMLGLQLARLWVSRQVRRAP